MSVSLSSVILSLNEQDKQQLQLVGLSSSALSDSWKQPPVAAIFLLQVPSSCILPVPDPPSLSWRGGRSHSPLTHPGTFEFLSPLSPGLAARGRSGSWGKRIGLCHWLNDCAES